MRLRAAVATAALLSGIVLASAAARGAGADAIADAEAVAAHAARARAAAEFAAPADYPEAARPAFEIGRLRLPAPVLQPYVQLAALPEHGVVFGALPGGALVGYDARSGAVVARLAAGRVRRSGGLVAVGDAASRRLVHLALDGPSLIYDATDPRALAVVAEAPPGTTLAPLPGARAGLFFGAGEPVLADLRNGRVLARLGGEVRGAAAARRRDGGTLLVVARPWGDASVLVAYDADVPAVPREVWRVDVAAPAGDVLIDRGGEIVVHPAARGFAVRDADGGGLLGTSDAPLPDGARLRLGEAMGARAVVAIAPDGFRTFDVTSARSPHFLNHLAADLGPAIEDRGVAVFHERPWVAAAAPAAGEIVAVEARSGTLLARVAAAPARPAAIAALEGNGDRLLVAHGARLPDGAARPGGTTLLRSTSLRQPSAPATVAEGDDVAVASLGRAVALGDRHVVAVDAATNALVVIDAALPAVVATSGLAGWTGPAAGAGAGTGGAAPPPDAFAGGDEDRRAATLLVAGGERIAVAVRGGRAAEAFIFDGARLVPQGVVETAEPVDAIALAAPGTLVVAAGRTLLTLDAGGRPGRLELPEPAERLVAHPDGGAVLAGATLVDLRSPGEPRRAWTGPAGAGAAAFVHGGAAVALTIAPPAGGSSLATPYAPQLFSAARGVPLGAPGEASTSAGPFAPALVAGQPGTDERLVYAQWSDSGWETVLYDVTRGTPARLATTPPYFHEASFAPRDDGRGWYELRPAPGSTAAPGATASGPARGLLLAGDTAGAYTSLGAVPLASLVPLRRGVIAGREAAGVGDGGAGGADTLLVLRDADLNRAPVAHAGPDRVLECGGPQGTRVTFDGSASADPDSAAGLADDIAGYAWTVDGRPAGETAAVEARVATGVHEAVLTVRDVLDAAASDAQRVTVVDTRPPAFTLAIEPAADDPRAAALWVPGGAADDLCDGPVVPRDRLLLERTLLNAPAAFVAGPPGLEVRVYRRGVRYELELSGEDEAAARETWRTIREAGGIDVAHDAAVELRLDETTDVPDLVATYRVAGRAGTLVRAASFVPWADYRIRARAQDAAGNTVEGEATFRRAKIAFCGANPRHAACR